MKYENENNNLAKLFNPFICTTERGSTVLSLITDRHTVVVLCEG